MHNLLEALADQDAERVMAQVASLAEQAPDFAAALQELLSLLHRIALVQMVPNALDDNAGDRVQLESLAERLTPEDVQLYYQIGLVGQRDLPLAPDPGSGFEMVLLRMLAFRPESGKARSAPAPAAPARPQPANTKPAPKPVAPSQSRPADQNVSPADPQDFSNWHQVIEQLKLGGIARQLANNCIYESWGDGTLKLHLDPAHQGMCTTRSEQNFQQALENYCGSKVKLVISVERPQSETPAQRQQRAKADRQCQAEQSMADDPMVRSVEETFSGNLVPGSVQPVDQ